MFRNTKQKSPFFSKIFSQDKLLVFGTIFFVTSVTLLVGMFLFPSVRTMLHDSALATGLASSGKSVDAAPAVRIFQDVDSSNPNAEAIAFLKNLHVITGYADGSFKPDAFVTRAELVKFLFEAKKVYPSPAVYRACFKDAQDQWFAPYACYSKAKGLTEGYPDGTFGADKGVTVAEALKILLLEYRVQLLAGPAVDTMKLEGSPWYAPYLWTAYDKKLIAWETPAEHQIPNLSQQNAPEAPLTRGQLAEILYRLSR